jgi:hypothetical protein
MRVVSALMRLDESVLPAKWLRREPDGLKRGVQLIYAGAVILVLGIVLFLAFDNSVGIIVGAGDMLIGAATVSAATRNQRQPEDVRE